MLKRRRDSELRETPEVDLVLEFTGKKTWAIEIKRSLKPTVRRGFHGACLDIIPDRKLLVYPGDDQYPAGNDI